MIMAEEAKQFLAVNVLNEERTVRFRDAVFLSLLTIQVSYRTLSRALKIHANLAKQYVFVRL